MRVDRPRTGCSGQALVETLLIGVLLSLVAALSLLWARVQAIDHSAAATSHLLAAECASAREVCADANRTEALAASLLRRQLGQRDREVLSGDAFDLRRAGTTEHAFFRGLDGRSLVQWAHLSGPTRDAQRFDAGLEIAARASGPRALRSGESLLDEAGPAVTITALAPVRSRWSMYLLLATKLTCPCDARSTGAHEWTSTDGSPCSVAPMRRASSSSLMKRSA